MIEFHNTVFGKHFFERQLPDLINALNRVADELCSLNLSTSKLLQLVSDSSSESEVDQNA